MGSNKRVTRDRKGNNSLFVVHYLFLDPPGLDLALAFIFLHYLRSLA